MQFRLVHRIVTFVRRRGVAAIPGTLVTNIWRTLFGNYHLCFALDGGSFTRTLRVPELNILKYEEEAAIVAGYLQQLLAEEGAEFLAQIREYFAHGAVLWLGLMNQRVVAYQWSRRGSNTKRYLVQIEPDDIVIFATKTFTDWRGRGINPAMMQYIVEKELAGRGTAFVNCKGWNKASLHGILKAGFTELGRYGREIDISSSRTVDQK
jgi:hypothetical protein